MAERRVWHWERWLDSASVDPWAGGSADELAATTAADWVDSWVAWRAGSWAVQSACQWVGCRAVDWGANWAEKKADSWAALRAGEWVGRKANKTVDWRVCSKDD